MGATKRKKTTSTQSKAGYFPVVGIGASAGGLTALETFFSEMSHKEAFKMAFVVIQHLSPTHDSILTEIINRFTSMKVFEVVSGITIEQNCVYIIPPNNNMALLEGKLILTKFDSEQNNRNPIDFFFNSLAENLGKNAAGIIFSGTGRDGSEGIKSISNNGGLVLVQTPDTSEFDGMPLGAISTGYVDFVLPIIEMPAKLINHFKNRSSNYTEDFTRNKPIKFEKTVADILELLKLKTGNDFSQYKSSTIERRIERRQISLHLETLDDYLIWLKKTPDEVETLFQDILIGLTRFFRDEEAFTALKEKVIPKLFEDKPNGGVIRIWSAGCSTGEEAYSIAILIQEQLQLVKQIYTIQIFATDLDGFAISKARTGVFSKSIEGQVSQERLQRFFVKNPDENSYQIRKGIRDMLIFSEHNVIKSPPFSKIDLIVCRNLMIYLDSQLQKKLLTTFHFALNQRGMLFLGSSETHRDSNDLFETVDRKNKLFSKKDFFLEKKSSAYLSYDSRKTAVETIIEQNDTEKLLPEKRSLREITEKALLNHFNLSAGLVNNTGDILFLQGRTGQYLEPSPGVNDKNNILKMAKDGLQLKLKTVFLKSVSSNEVKKITDIIMKIDGMPSLLSITVRPLLPTFENSSEERLYLVIFEHELTKVNTDSNTEKTQRENSRNSDILLKEEILELKNEILSKDEGLLYAIEELESINEELKSSNEEMQSINEEMQSSNEELETSREEMQSINEELATVNSELSSKVLDLSTVYSDMNNLLAGTNIGTVFVDFDFKVLRFTPAVASILNLIPGDVGRPIVQIVSNLIGYKKLAEDLESILKDLSTLESEVQTDNGEYYIMKIQPYRTIENVIAGAVITFVNVTERKKAQAEKSLSEIRFRRLFEACPDGIILLDAETGKIKNVNPQLISLLGYSEKVLVEKSIWDIGLFKDIANNRDNFLELQQKEFIRYEDLPLETSDGRIIEVEFISNVYFVNDKKVIQCHIRDISKRKKLEQKRKEKECDGK